MAKLDRTVSNNGRTGANVRAALAGPRRRHCSVVAFLLCLGACAQNLPVPSATEAVLVADAPAALSDVDQRFLVAAVASLQYQEEAARLAAQRSIDPAVKAHAALVIEQRSRAAEALRQMATLRNLAWPDGMPAERRNELTTLAGLPPETFDRRFIEQVSIADQQADVEMFEVASRSLNDPALRAWAQRVLPSIQQQLIAARSLPLARKAVT